MNAGIAQEQIRTYGGWRKAKGMGLFGLGPGATVVVMATGVIGLLSVTISMRLFLIWALPGPLIIALTIARCDGETLAERGQRLTRWRWAKMRGWTSLRSGVLIDHPRAWQLPGVLAPTRVLSVEDGRGGHFGVVHDQRSGLLTATLRCDARSTWLVEDRQADGWISNWHAWLADLGMMPMVVWVAVTIETAPEPGTTLEQRVIARIDPQAPLDALRLLDDLVAASPAASSSVTTRVSITFDPTRSNQALRDLVDQTAEVARLLTGLESSLSDCGVGVLGRTSAAALAGVVRVAFDPAARGDVNRLIDERESGAGKLLIWGEAGPVAAEEHWDCYQHDSGWSRVYGWQEPPRQQVVSSVLCALLQPSRWPTRVTLLYRPFSAAGAARELENEVNAATIRAALRTKQGLDPRARDLDDHDRARQAAHEEAMGAGVVQVMLIAAVSVADKAELSIACADLESRAQQSKIHLRPLYGGQSAGFAATLPAGIHPTHLLRRGRR